MNAWLVLAPAVILLAWLPRLRARLLLSRAKHPSLAGHARLSKRLARLVPFYSYGDEEFFSSDGAPVTIADRRRAGFKALADTLATRAPRTLQASLAMTAGVSDMQFIDSYRVPFQYRDMVRRHLPLGSIVQRSVGVQVSDLDGNTSYDVAGSYGVNVFGYDFYKDCVDRGIERARELGPVLGAYHPLVADNVERLRRISGLDEVSFHMSGTEAVMQAVRLARYHTRRSHIVQFTGAYHGWWDGVQPGVGNPRRTDDVYLLKEMDETTVRVLCTRRDIACVLVNPLQMLHPNASAPGDASLLASGSRPAVGRDEYAAWLRRLREICAERSIVLIFDEVFLGFRLALGGAQEYFGVRADMVTYGKTVGGGLPVGVLCGRAAVMRRFRNERPADICFARGTFNAHPYVMGSMNEFLRRLDAPDVQQSYLDVERVWNLRAAMLNAELERERLPVRVANVASVWTIRYLEPSRYNWMFQYYLRAQGLSLSWVGSGRLIFSHNYSDADVAVVSGRIVSAAVAMSADGWWWHLPTLTDESIKRQVLREMLAVTMRSMFSGLPAQRSDRTAPRAAGTPERCDTA